MSSRSKSIWLKSCICYLSRSLLIISKIYRITNSCPRWDLNEDLLIRKKAPYPPELYFVILTCFAYFTAQLSTFKFNRPWLLPRHCPVLAWVVYYFNVTLKSFKQSNIWLMANVTVYCNDSQWYSTVWRKLFCKLEYLCTVLNKRLRRWTPIMDLSASVIMTCARNNYIPRWDIWTVSDGGLSNVLDNIFALDIVLSGHLSLKLLRTNIKYSFTTPHFFNYRSQSMHLLPWMNVMLDFICMGPIELLGAQNKQKLQN